MRYECSSGHLAITSCFFFILLITVPVAVFAAFSKGWCIATVQMHVHHSHRTSYAHAQCLVHISHDILTSDSQPICGGKVNCLMSVSPFELSTHLESSLARPFTFFNADELYSVSRVLKG